MEFWHFEDINTNNMLDYKYITIIVVSNYLKNYVFLKPFAVLDFCYASRREKTFPAIKKKISNYFEQFKLTIVF